MSKVGKVGREGTKIDGVVSAGGWAFVISFELIPLEQMVNGGLPRCLESQELTVACVHVEGVTPKLRKEERKPHEKRLQ